MNNDFFSSVNYPHVSVPFGTKMKTDAYSLSTLHTILKGNRKHSLTVIQLRQHTLEGGKSNFSLKPR